MFRTFLGRVVANVGATFAVAAILCFVLLTEPAFFVSALIFFLAWLFLGYKIAIAFLIGVLLSSTLRRRDG
jgi:hypothetical protein